MPRKRKLPPPSPEIDKAALIKDALTTSGWAPGGEVIDDLIVVPTGCHGLDAATGIGGIPVETITTIYGDSQTGKTALALAICRAFIDAGGIACYIDAEKALRDDEHIAKMLGFVRLDENGEWQALEKEEWPDTFWLPPRGKDVYYEHAVEMVSRLASASRKLADADPSYPGAVVIIDSLDTLVPEGMLEGMLKDFKSSKASADTSLTKGRNGQRTANVAGEWVRQLVSVSHASRLATVLICQERFEVINDYKRPYPRGGKASVFYGSLIFRVARAADGAAGQYFAGSKGSGSDRVIGSRHKVQLRKSRFGNITELGSRWIETEFFLSNGLGPSPAGVDKARDLLEAGIARGVLTQAGSSIRLGDETIGRGFATAHRALATDPEVYARVYAAFVDAVDAMDQEMVGLVDSSLDGEDL